MVDPIPESIKKIWDDWNIRGVILLSLSLQVLLIVFSPMRKGTANKVINMVIWSVYLLADWSAIFAIGLITNSQRESTSPDISSMPAENSDLLVFWAPFLFLHLGGPDNITAFALEDNDLWIRHFVGLLIQAVAVIYIFLLSVAKTKLAAPTILIFIAGNLKYLERTRAFYLASFDGFQDSLSTEPDPGPNYEKLMGEYSMKKAANIHTTLTKIRKPVKESTGRGVTVKKLDDQGVVHYAYQYFQTYKGVIVDLFFDFHQHIESRIFFCSIYPEDALRVIEVELNLIYEVLYTKVQVVHSLIGRISRFISFSLVVAAFLLFHFKVNKHGFDKFDVAITYILFLGAIVLDIIALFILISFDLTLGTLKDPEDQDPDDQSKFLLKIKSQLCIMLSWILNFKKSKWCACCNHPEELKHQVLATPFLFGRWSGYVSGHNLLRYCLKGRPTRIHKVNNRLQQGIKEVIHSVGEIIDPFIQILTNAIVKVTSVSLVDKFINLVIQFFGLTLGKLINFLTSDFLDEIRFVSREPLTKELWNFIFDEVKVKSLYVENPEDAKKISSTRGEWILKDSHYRDKLMPYVSQVTYDESLLLWHIATELLYQYDDEVTNEHREFSKILSDYMLYLLIIQPTTMSAVAGIAKTRFRDTCAESLRFFKRKRIKANQEKKACYKILNVNTDVKPSTLKGVRSKSVLFDASMLAKELIELDDKWELLSKMWVELLSYAACYSRSRTHAQQVSKGGELITFVWLLMVHFGLQQQFQNIAVQENMILA